MTKEQFEEIEKRVLSWSHKVNPQRRTDALVLIGEIKRLKTVVHRLIEGKGDHPTPPEFY